MGQIFAAAAIIQSVATTRFAPSPTGDLHLGGAWTALASWALARANGGRTVLRVEDIDTPRVVKGSASRILEDLRWLGFDWDVGPIFQSDRTSLYEAALARLDAAGLTYLCDCSRAEIARAASAPHAGEEGKETIYPGTCRDAPRDRELKRLPAIRLRVPQGAIVRFDDAICGSVEEDVGRSAGDFVLRRGDGVFAYQLVVAIDDAEMGVSHVVRADDLLGSTARQMLLMRLLGHTSAPTYAHVPLVLATEGERLAKRTRGATVRELAEQGVRPEAIVGELARGLGLVPPERQGSLSPREVAAALVGPTAWRKTPWPMTRAFV
jgi:glutamyl-tRNA synthetase